MDATLTQILAGLYEAHQAIDRLQAELANLRAELAQRGQRIAELEAELEAEPETDDGPAT